MAIATRGLLAIWCLVALSGVANAAPLVGQPYTVGCGLCLPSSFSREPVTYDGVSDTVNGGSLAINESFTPLPDGGWYEFSASQVDGSRVLPSLGLWQIGFVDVQLDTVVQHSLAPGDVFVYFTIDGVPQSMQPPIGVGGSVAPHPTDPGISSVWFIPSTIPSAVGSVQQFGFFISDPDATLLGLGLDAAQINDVHFGFVAVNVPEPAGALSLALALASLALARRR